MNTSKTPLCDFVRAYAASDAQRLHMPGHKGRAVLGCEPLDITEIDGADVLYHADGILAESQGIARDLFSTQKTLYSAEGSSLSIRAMLYLAQADARLHGRSNTVLAGRNAHKVFFTAAALLDFETLWLSGEDDGLLTCRITHSALDEALNALPSPPAAVYITSPDYLGNVQDIAALARVCHAHGTLLLVDNAHGAYLHFLDTPCHPMDLGADLCCDSAHKTLCALTGAGYLHIGHTVEPNTAAMAEAAMALFASTSPSYLILQSLDALGAYLSDAYREDLRILCKKLQALRKTLTAHGWQLCGDEPCKLTVAPKSFGYTGEALAQILIENRLIPEFYDRDYVVLMVTPQTSDKTLSALAHALCALEAREAITEVPPTITAAKRIMSPRQALLAPSETLPVDDCLHRVLAQPTVGCPPAVPIAVSGEEITEDAISAFRYWGIEKISVVMK